jgi:hypothetical protein
MKFKAVAVCAVVASGISAGSALGHGGEHRDDLRYARAVGSCDAGTPGVVAVAGGVANLVAPEQMSWAQIRAYPEDLTLSQIERLSFRSNASDPGVVYMRLTLAGDRTVVFSPNTQPGGEQGVGTWATHDVLAGTVRLDDPAGTTPDITWEQMIATAGDLPVEDVRVTAGCAGAVGSDGALVRVDDLTINDEDLEFGRCGRARGSSRTPSLLSLLLDALGLSPQPGRDHQPGRRVARTGDMPSSCKASGP